MADKSEVIHEQMEGTRKGLTDKLEKLEAKISGTVETVSSTAEAVTHTVETVKDSVTDTVQAVTEGVGNTVETVKEGVRSFFDVPGHVDRHPWLMMGGSVLMGFLGGRLLSPRATREERPAGTPTYAPAYTPTAFASSEERGRQAEEQGKRAEEEGWLSKLGEQFGDQLGQLKGLALGTTLGIVRDMVSQWVPDSLRRDVTEIVNGFTSRLGGQVIQRPILDEPEAREEPSPRAEGQSTADRRGGNGASREKDRGEEAVPAATRTREEARLRGQGRR